MRSKTRRTKFLSIIIGLIAAIGLLATGTIAAHADTNDDAAATLVAEVAAGQHRSANVDATRLFGVVDWYNEGKGYGYIKTQSFGDWFAHFSQIRGGGVLYSGQNVSFDPCDGPHGPMACDITALSF